MLGVDALDRCMMELHVRSEELWKKEKEIYKKRDAASDEATPEEEEFWVAQVEAYGIERLEINRCISHMRLQMHLMTAFAKFKEALAPILCSDLAKKIWDNVESGCLKQEKMDAKQLDDEWYDAFNNASWLEHEEATECGELPFPWLAEREARPYWREWYMRMAYRYFDPHYHIY
tara:strand:+ start:1134 stop:1658 length:525 start_codon:yes stop_codon:yes gene_type:complete